MASQSRCSESNRTPADQAEGANAEYVKTSVAADLMAIPPRAVLRLARAGHIRMRQLPGMRPTFLIDDVRRFAPPS